MLLHPFIVVLLLVLSFEEGQKLQLKMGQCVENTGAQTNTGHVETWGFGIVLSKNDGFVLTYVF